MGLTDTLGDVADKAAGALGADAGGDGPKPDAGKPEYKVKDPLDPPKDKKPITAGPNGDDTDPNTAQPPDPTEFVHFGYVHADTTDHYAHPKYDNEKDKKPAGRAILFRDAVEREAMLLFNYVNATKTVHEELQKNKGVAGEVAGAIGSLMGSSGKEPDPKTYKYFINAITKTGGDINAEACDYVKIHKGGIDLHQARADYVKFCTDKLEGYYLGTGKDDSKSLLMSLPSVAGAAKTVFGILFKAFDIYFAIYLKFRSAYEKTIEDACYAFSIDVVKKYTSNTYAPWFRLPKDNGSSSSSTLPSVLGDAENKYNQAKKDVTDFEKDELQAQDPAPGEDALKGIFAIFGSGGSDDKKDKKDGDAAADDKPQSAADAAKDKPKPNPPDALVVDGFNTVLGTKLPGFLATGIGKIVWGDVEFLKTVYMQLLDNEGKKIDEPWLLDAAHKCIFDKLYGFIEDNVSFIKGIEDAKMGVMGTDVGPGRQIDKGKDALAQKLGSYADPVLKLAVGKFSDALEKIRSDADKNKGTTMEVFLGYLPYLLAFQIRNTTFPVWDLLINELLGKGNAALDAAIKPVRNFIGDARNVTKDVKDKKDATKEAMDKWDKDGGLNSDQGQQQVTDYKNIFTKDRNKDADKAGAGGDFPGGARKTAGNADKIKSDDLDKAKKDRKDNWPVNP